MNRLFEVSSSPHHQCSLFSTTILYTKNIRYLNVIEVLKPNTVKAATSSFTSSLNLFNEDNFPSKIILPERRSLILQPTSILPSIT